MEVSPGTGVYYNTSKLLLSADFYHKKPKAMFLNLLRSLLPPSVIQNQALSRTGSRDTVAIPPNILAAARGELFATASVHENMTFLSCRIYVLNSYMSHLWLKYVSFIQPKFFLWLQDLSKRSLRLRG